MNDQTLALLVLGPAHGTQVMLPTPLPEYLVPEQRDLRLLSDARDQGYTLDHLKVHVYRRICQLSDPKHRGCFVYEHFGVRDR